MLSNSSLQNIRVINFHTAGEPTRLVIAGGPDLGTGPLSDKLGTFNYWTHNSSRNGLYVRRSLDGDKTWEQPDHTIIAQPSEPGVPWEDKPYIVSDTTQGP